MMKVILNIILIWTGDVPTQDGIHKRLVNDAEEEMQRLESYMYEIKKGSKIFFLSDILQNQPT